MSQHDFDIANQTASNARADINAALQALASNSSGIAEPTTKYANQFWYDTANNILKLRNEANSAWLNVGYIDQTGGFRVLDDTKVVNTSGSQTGLLGDQSQATWEAGVGTTESLISPAKIKAAIDAIAVGGKPTTLIIDKLASPTNVALTASAWNTAYLTVTSIDAGYTLSSNAVTVPAGTYYAEFSIPVSCTKSDRIGAAVVRLRNVTAGSTAVLGQSAEIGDWQCLNMHGAGQFTVASSSALRLEIWVNESSAYQRRFTNASDASGEDQVFAMLKLWKL